jgi:thiamine biosynthesis lipoprotein
MPLAHRFAHLAMGTTFEVWIAGWDEGYASQVSQALFSEVDRIERLLSRFNPCSEISQISRLGPGHSLLVGIETFECLKIGEEIRAQTDGAFNMNFRTLAKHNIDASPSIELSQTTHGFEVRFQSPEVGQSFESLSLDLGAIGKGYALDKALTVFSDWSIECALIHGGTSTAIAVDSPPDRGLEGRGWPVSVGGVWPCHQAPRKFFLKDRALSGSGTEVKGKHIFDPRKGLPAQGHLAAWASHPSAAVADALSTAFMVMSTEEVENYCKRHPDVWALVILDPETCRTFNDNLRE